MSYTKISLRRRAVSENNSSIEGEGMARFFYPEEESLTRIMSI